MESIDLDAGEADVETPEGHRFRRVLDAGVGLVEYALLVALITVAALSAIQFFANSSNDKFYDSCAEIRSAGSDAELSCR
jgi:Flp pilus assembly pilin Flp